MSERAREKDLWVKTYLYKYKKRKRPRTTTTTKKQHKRKKLKKVKNLKLKKNKTKSIDWPNIREEKEGEEKVHLERKKEKIDNKHQKGDFIVNI